MEIKGNKEQILLIFVRQVKCLGVTRGQLLLFPYDRWLTAKEIIELGEAIHTNH